MNGKQTAEYIAKRDEMVKELRQRITELEGVIVSHGIPVKTYTGGVAHYVSGERE